MRFFLAIICILMSIAYAISFVISIQKQNKIEIAKKELRKLNIIALNFYRQGKVINITEDFFDPWGVKFRLSGEDRLTRWESAGPDKEFGTIDDLVLAMAKVAAELEAQGIDVNVVAPASDSDGAALLRGQ